MLGESIIDWEMATTVPLGSGCYPSLAVWGLSNARLRSVRITDEIIGLGHSQKEC